MKRSAWVLFITAVLAAQPPSTPQVRSPEIESDGRVTFRLLAPQATDVTVRGEWMKANERTPLVKAENGVWSVTVAAVPPELLSYTIYVHGVPVVDPRNPLIKPGVSSTTSLIDIPGPEVEFHALKQVPHGTVHVHWYWSKAVNKHRRVHIYTPPGYDAAKSTRYPVLYLLHGAGDTDGEWVTVGRANRILDNLIAAGKAKPMLIVMPDGHAAGPGMDAVMRGQNTKLFEQDLMGEVIPLVEAGYKTAKGAENRALAGLSMGGNQTMHIGFNNLPMFGSLAVFSSSAGFNEEMMKDFEKRFGPLMADADKVNRQLQLLWIGCGTADFLYKRSMATVEMLKNQNIRHVYRETEGAGHTWPLWRKYLAEVSAMLFRKAGS